MKHIWYALPMAAVTLSGCSSMMYGSNVAPVTNQSVVYGKPVEVNQSAAATATQPTAQAAQAQQQANVQLNQPSPYDAAPAPDANQRIVPPNSENGAPAATTANNSNDGWAIRPSGETPAATPDAQTANAQPPATPAADQPIRPQTPASTPAENNQPAPAATPSAPAASNNQSQQVASASQPAPASNNGSGQSAVDTLLHQASAALGKGDLDGAAAYLEDASRIQPKNSKIMYDIANIRYHQGKYRAAEAAASRAVRVGGGNDMMKKTWSLIANSRKQLGDNQGAITAAEKAASL